MYRCNTIIVLIKTMFTGIYIRFKILLFVVVIYLLHKIICCYKLHSNKICIFRTMIDLLRQQHRDWDANI